MVPRRSARLHPQIHATEQSAGVTRRRSSRPHPEVHASAGMTRRTGTSPAAPAASLPDDEDMLREILVRLPPQPSSLPRASAVCKRWRCIIGDPKFHRQFYAHHRKPPLLGVFQRSHEGIVFTPMLDPPDRVPPARVSRGRCSNRDEYEVLNCRHGLVLVHHWARGEVLVCDPITSEQRRVATPPELRRAILGGAVLCAATDPGHVHGGCHSSPFKVVVVSTDGSDSRDLACVYSSETGVWGNLISTPAPSDLSDVSATLVGNALYWLTVGDQILEFDLDGQSLALITGLPITTDLLCRNHHIIQGEDGAIGLAVLSRPRGEVQTWQRKVNCHGVATWIPWKTIAMHTILGLPSPIEGLFGRLLGYDEDNGVIFLYVQARVYTVQLMSMQSRKLHETRNLDDYYPFTSFFIPDQLKKKAHNV
ncbi:unnamed protein product [Alopecurus aequalis]